MDKIVYKNSLGKSSQWSREARISQDFAGYRLIISINLIAQRQVVHFGVIYT